MRSFNFGTGFAVFVLFFGISLLDAFQSGNYLRATFWLAMGMVFWSCDNILKRRKS